MNDEEITKMLNQEDKEIKERIKEEEEFNKKYDMDLKKLGKEIEEVSKIGVIDGQKERKNPSLKDF